MSSIQTGIPFKIVPFEAWHARAIQLQGAQKMLNDMLETDDYAQMLANCGDSYSAVQGDQVLCSCGVVDVLPWIGRAWGIVGENSGRNMIAITRAVQAFLNKTDYDRVETPVKRDFAAGHRWAKMLGFVNETAETGMKYYGIGGETFDLYAFYPKESQRGKHN